MRKELYEELKTRVERGGDQPLIVHDPDRHGECLSCGHNVSAGSWEEPSTGKHGRYSVCEREGVRFN